MYRLLIVVVLFLNGCGNTDIEKLKALNTPQSETNNTNVSKIIEKKVELNTTNAEPPIPVVKVLTEEERKYKLSLQEINKEVNLTVASSNLQLSLAKLENEEQKNIKIMELELAKLSMKNSIDESNIELQKVQEEEKTKHLALTQAHQKEIEITKINQALEKEKEQNKALQIKENMEFYKIVAVIVGILFLLTLLIIFLLKRRKEKNLAKSRQDELNQQMQFKMMEEQSKNLDKMLEIVKSKDLSENVEKEILATIKESQRKTLIFEEKPKKSLIFKK